LERDRRAAGGGIRLVEIGRRLLGEISCQHVIRRNASLQSARRGSLPILNVAGRDLFHAYKLARHTTDGRKQIELRGGGERRAEIVANDREIGEL
jgi:hypothetical protein